MAPIFVGPTDDDSKIRDNRIGFAISTANPGTASEGDIYFNSTDKQLRGYDGSAWAAIGGGGGGTAEFTVSGSLSDGQTVILKSDGNVSGIGTVDPSNTTQQQFDSDKCYATSAIYIGSGKVLISYRDAGNSNYGTSIVASISGSTITYGSPVVFESANSDDISSTYDSGNSKFVIAYKVSSTLKTIVGSVSGTTITFGTAETLNSGRSLPEIIYTGSSTGKLIAAYVSGYYRVGAISGTSITWQSEQTIASSIGAVSLTFDTTSNRVAFFYTQSTTTYQLKLKIGTLSGNTITLGSEIDIDDQNCQQPKASITSTSGNSSGIVVCSYYVYYSGGVNVNKSFIAAAQLTGSSGNTISGSVATSHWWTHYGGNNTLSLDTSSGSSVEKFLLTANNGRYNEAIIAAGGSGPTITTNTQKTLSFASPVSTDYVDRSTNVWVPTVNKLLYAFMDDGNGGSYAFLITPYSSNLTSSNFLGFSDAAYTNGQTATVQMVGAVDDAQSGLTTATRLFVQTDGSLGTTAATPSVLAGTAISGTKIIVRK